VTDIRDYRELKQKAENIRVKRDRATGQLESSMEQLDTEFGCKTLKDARAELKKRMKEADEAESAYLETARHFEEKWGAIDEDE